MNWRVVVLFMFTFLVLGAVVGLVAEEALVLAIPLGFSAFIPTDSEGV